MWFFNPLYLDSLLLLGLIITYPRVFTIGLTIIFVICQFLAFMGFIKGYETVFWGIFVLAVIIGGVALIDLIFGNPETKKNEHKIVLPGFIKEFLYLIFYIAAFCLDILVSPFVFFRDLIKTNKMMKTVDNDLKIVIKQQKNDKDIIKDNPNK